MLSISAYDPAYVAWCRTHIARQLEAFREAERVCTEGNVLSSLEKTTFLNMVLALDALFGHRARGQEAKDGNALNEVRMICGSLLKGLDRLQADKTIRYDPARSVLGLDFGSELIVTADGFERLAGRFLDEIVVKYPSATSQ